MTSPLVDDSGEERSIPLSALILGFGGLIPFFGLVTLLALTSQPDLKFFIGRSLVSYAAVILSFLGGARWGLALRCKDRRLQAMNFALAILPPLCAWPLLTARLDTAIASFAILFAIIGLLDAITMRAMLAPPWYARLRTMLSTLVVVALVGAMFTL